MFDSGSSSSRARVWTYEGIASRPAGARLEDHLLTAVRKITARLDVAGVCDAVLSGVEAVFGATSSWIMLHDSAHQALRTVTFRGTGADVYREVELPLGRGIVGLVFTRREIHFVPDVREDDRWFKPERVRASGLRSALIVPLVADDKVIGVLGLDSLRFGPSRPPSELELKQLEVFAGQAAIGIINARLYEASQQDRARLRSLLRQRRDLRQEVQELRQVVRDAYSFGPIVGESEAMQRVLAEVAEVARSDITVLLLGETGTGKELLARALHERSSRAARPFVPVNCAALPESLVESELFGHERGAFTGAVARKPGRFELAHRGTLFLDEVGDLPLSAQAKLLRVLQDGEIMRVGGTQSTNVDVRLVAATNRDLSAGVASRDFREDLYYRLSVFPIRVPPLRERLEDVAPLAHHFARHCAARLGKPLSALERAAIERLSNYSWPGNVRELQNIVERGVILMRGDVLGVEAIRLDTAPGAPLQRRSSDPSRAAGAGALASAAPGASAPSDPATTSAARTLADAERDAILAALRSADGRVSGPGGAAALLGLKPTTLHAKMKKLGIRRQDGIRYGLS